MFKTLGTAVKETSVAISAPAPSASPSCPRRTCRTSQLAKSSTACEASQRGSTTPLEAKASLPPLYPGSLPFLGHYFQIDLDSFHQSGEAMYKRQAARSFRLQLFGIEAVHMRHPDDCLAVLDTQASSFIKVPNIKRLTRLIGDGLVSQADKGKHRKMRELLQPAMLPGYVNKLLPSFLAAAQQLCAALAQEHGQPVNMQYLAKCASLDIIGLTSFRHDFGALRQALQGKRAPGEVDLVQMLSDAQQGIRWLSFDFPIPDGLTPGFGSYRACTDAIDGIIGRVVNGAMANDARDDESDLLGYMLRSQQSSGFPTLEQIRDEVKTIVFAGMDTTSSSLAFTLYELSQHPASMRRACGEVRSALGAKPLADWTALDMQQLPFVTACIKENLRLFPPAPFTGRIATEDVVIHGQLLPQGTLTFLDFSSLHLHEEFWPCYQDWMPERWLPEGAEYASTHRHGFMPFGLGARGCIGRSFAMLELQTLLAAVLCTTDIEAEPGFVPQQQVGITLLSKNGIFVRAAARDT